MRGVDFLEGAVASCGPAVKLWAVVMRQGRVKAEGGQVLRRGGCEGRGRDESIRSEQASGVGVGGGRAGETGRGGRWPVGGRGKVPIKTSRAITTHGGAGRADFAKVNPRAERSRRNAPTWSRCSTLKNPYLPPKSKWSKGNVGGPEVDVSDKSQAVVGGTLGGGDAGGVTRRLV